MQRLRQKSASWEIYSGLRARPPLVARADGRGFKNILAGCKKPYDAGFAGFMASSASSLFEDSGICPVLAFTFSDEINLAFLTAPFGGRIEKIDSLVASFLSAALSLQMGRPVSMDCRTIPLCRSEIREYLIERQNEAWRNHVFSYGFYMLQEEGLDPSQAMERMRGMREPEIHEMLFQRGTNLAKTPSWERRGIMIYRDEGRVLQDWQLPLFSSEEGEELLARLFRCAENG
ncbi:tRNA(His) guanylyltransferase Thg1 family protein [Methanothrix sp.]|uniref:tRNA(His) guanylyltransferase Thg1 family protein n=1 Tax=Methanothrix sp. TaxID=90426 RepID=UPI003C78CC35